MAEFGGMMIGIIDTSEDLTASYTDYFHIVIKKAYALNFKFGSLFRGYNNLEKNHYCKGSEKGDIVEMCLDLNTLQLSYIVNNENCGKGFDIQYATYRAAISVHMDNDTLELMQYVYQQR